MWWGRDPDNITQITEEESHKSLKKKVLGSANTLRWECTGLVKEHKDQGGWKTGRDEHSDLWGGEWGAQCRAKSLGSCRHGFVFETWRKAVRFNAGEWHDLIYSLKSSLCLPCAKLEAGKPIRKLFQSLFHGGWANVQSVEMEKSWCILDVIWARGQ